MCQWLGAEAEEEEDANAQRCRCGNACSCGWCLAAPPLNPSSVQASVGFFGLDHQGGPRGPNSRVLQGPPGPHTGTSPVFRAPWVLDNPCIFSQLKHLQLLLFILREDLDKILSLTTLLGASPFLQKLEFCIYALWPFDYEHPMVLRSLSPCQYSHLKVVLVTGYKGAIEQLEFLAHIAENASGLELSTIDTVEALWNDIFGSELSISLVLEHHVRDISLEHHVRDVAASYLRERLAPTRRL
uniref:At1g61320/AtMIF1 LRR domain-containing protein n=2 Tax=Oryza punctata TaxID=4537 RepID=A0A0E0KE56_ORYPU